MAEEFSPNFAAVSFCAAAYGEIQPMDLWQIRDARKRVAKAFRPAHTIPNDVGHFSALKQVPLVVKGEVESTNFHHSSHLFECPEDEHAVLQSISFQIQERNNLILLSQRLSLNNYYTFAMAVPT